MFEIGSVTKVFTSLLLADMVQRGEVALTDPIGKYLPADVKVPERNGHAITLEDLATHTSGLPRMPTNFTPKDPANPYADYSVAQLYQFLSTTRYHATSGHDTSIRIWVGDSWDTSSLVVPGWIRSTGSLPHHRPSRDDQHQRHPVGGSAAAAGCGPQRSVGSGPQLGSADAGRSWRAPIDGERHADVPCRQLGATKSPLASAMTAMLTDRRPTGTPGLDMALGWHVSRETATTSSGTTAAPEDTAPLSDSASRRRSASWCSRIRARWLALTTSDCTSWTRDFPSCNRRSRTPKSPPIRICSMVTWARINSRRISY